MHRPWLPAPAPALPQVFGKGQIEACLRVLDIYVPINCFVDFDIGSEDFVLRPSPQERDDRLHVPTVVAVFYKSNSL